MYIIYVLYFKVCEEEMNGPLHCLCCLMAGVIQRELENLQAAEKVSALFINFILKILLLWVRSVARTLAVAS